jgi:hypothetical protein
VPVSPNRVARLSDALDHLQHAVPRLQVELKEATGGRFEVTASRAVLRELIAVALDEAGEALAMACRGLLHGEDAPAAVRERLVEVAELLDVLDAVERPR